MKRQNSHLIFLFCIGLAACQNDQPSEKSAQKSQGQADTQSKNNTDVLFKSVAPLLKSSGAQWAFSDIQNTGPIVSEKDYRWQVGLLIQKGEAERCGGVLVSKLFILTAAHCVDANIQTGGVPVPVSFSAIQVFHGADEFSKGTRLALDTGWPIKIHEKWRTAGEEGAYDVAILKLKQPIAQGVTAPVRSSRFDEGPAIVSGWGSYDFTETPSAYLRAVRLPVVKNGLCRETLALNPNVGQANQIGDWSLCTVSTTDSACSRDSGGPLVIGSAERPQTIGIVSWSGQRKCRISDPLPSLVTVYMRASEIAPWVIKITGDPSAVTSSPPGTLFEIKPRNDI